MFGVVSLLFAERFNDVTVMTSGDVNFFKRPSEYTVDEGRLLSGRPYIWSSYIFAWLDGDLTEYVIGFGPESWNDIFPLYAHNTLVNYLYEYAPSASSFCFGFGVRCWFAAARAPPAGRRVLVGAHLSYIVLNMATMPMWMVEGNILYGLICGYTLSTCCRCKDSNSAPVRYCAPPSSPAAAALPKGAPLPSCRHVDSGARVAHALGIE